jgi:RNA polymerase sigma factor (sigma-70 family)
VTIDPLRDLSFAIAYRMLGTVSEAEDVVQEALLRLHSAEGVENREAFLTTVTTRLAIDVLRSARVRRETYTGAWLPEPLVEDDAIRRVEDEETISLAFLVLLERLTPDERAVLVLRDSFDYSFAEIGEVLGKSEQNCRQILSRARRRIGEERPRFDADPEQRRTLAARFLAAAREGDIEGLVAVLAPGAVLVGDGGGKARALPRPLSAPRGSPARSSSSRASRPSGRSRSSRCSSTASPASGCARPTGASSTSSRSTWPTARSSASTRCSTRTSSAISAPSRTWACGRRCGKPHPHDACHLQCPRRMAAA